MIHVAIVGMGNIAHAHVTGLLTFPDRYNLKCAVFDDRHSMLDSGIKIDLVHVCTPPYVHAQIAIDSMDAGCNVLVEKPMATCPAECDAMLDAEKRNNVTLGCIAQNRFRNSIYKLKKTVDRGLAGKICLAQVESVWWRGHCYYNLWWRGTSPSRELPASQFLSTAGFKVTVRYICPLLRQSSFLP